MKLTGASIQGLGLVPLDATDVADKTSAAIDGRGAAPGPVWSFEREGRAGGRVEWLEAPSLGALAAAVNQTGINDAWDNSGSNGMDLEWYGGTWTSAMEMIGGAGWDAALPALDAAIVAGRDVEEQRFSQKFDVTGGSSIGIDRYVSGDPRCVRRWAQQPVKSPTISLAVSLCADWRKDADVLARWAAAIGAVVMDAQRQNVTVEVVAYAATQKRDSTWVLSVPVADSRALVGPALMLYGMGHPSFLRRVKFAALDWFSTPGTREKIGRQYGRPTRPDWSIDGQLVPWANEGGADGIAVMPLVDDIYRLSDAEMVERVRGIVESAL